MNNYRTIRHEKDGLLSTIVLNRPESMNALNEEMIREINEAIDYVEGDSSTQVLIFTD